MQNTKQTTIAFATVTTLFFAWGFITSNNDPLIAALRAIFSLSYTQALLTQFAFFLAYGVLSFPAAGLLARLGAVRAVAAALGGMIAACFIIILATKLDTYALVLVGLFALAGGITALQVAANPLAASLGEVDRSHFRLVLAQAFNSLGVVLGAHFGSKIMLSGDVFKGKVDHIVDPASRLAALAAVDHAFLMIALFIACLAGLFWFQHRIIDAASQSSTAGPSTAFDALRSRWALFGALAIFLYVGAEVSIGSIMINFLNRKAVLDLPLQEAGGYLANFYWGGALAGRFLGSWLLTHFPAPKLLLGAAGVAALLCIVAFLSAGPVAAYAALSVGLFNAIMFPVIFTLTLERTTASQASTSGLLCTAIVGGAIVPLMVGAIADRFSLTAAFAIPALAYLVIAGFARAAASHRNVTATTEHVMIGH